MQDARRRQEERKEDARSFGEELVRDRKYGRNLMSAVEKSIPETVKNLAGLSEDETEDALNAIKDILGSGPASEQVLNELKASLHEKRQE